MQVFQELVDILWVNQVGAVPAHRKDDTYLPDGFAVIEKTFLVAEPDTLLISCIGTDIDVLMLIQVVLNRTLDIPQIVINLRVVHKELVLPALDGVKQVHGLLQRLAVLVKNGLLHQERYI